MKGRLFLFLAALVLFLPAVIGTEHLSFATNRREVNITRDGCGTDKLCLETPDRCDPNTNTSMCLFMSSDVVMSSPTVLTFELRGHSQGYIAMGLTMNASQGMTMLFVCAQNSSDRENIFFRTARRINTSPNDPPTLTERNVTEIRGVVKDNIIRCEFNVPGLNFTNINYTVLLGSGNVTRGSLDTFHVLLTRGPLSLTDPSRGSSNPTSPPPTTPAPSPLIITRTGCGTDKLCLETPSVCDPAGNSECLFTSLVVNVSMPPNGAELSIELRGDSAGYIALGLTSTASPEMAMVFVCAQNSSNNGRFFFNTLQRNNSDPNAALTPFARTVTDLRGEVNGNVIKCIFKVPNVNSTRRRNAATTFAVVLGKGSVNGGSIGALIVALNRSSLNLGNPALGSRNPTPAPPPTTPAPSPLVITRAGCGRTKLCLETPSTCNPAGNGECLFTSVVANTSMSSNGAELGIELRGDSDGYIALGLISTASPNMAMVFACAQNSSNNGSFFFRTLQRNNSNPNATLTALNRTVTNIRGEVKGNVIRCIFNIPNVNSTRKRNAATTFTVLLGKGSINGNSFGIFLVSLTRGPLNLADPSLGSSVTTQSPATTDDAVSSHPHALLLLSALVLSIMLRN